MRLLQETNCFSEFIHIPMSDSSDAPIFHNTKWMIIFFGDKYSLVSLHTPEDRIYQASSNSVGVLIFFLQRVSSSCLSLIKYGLPRRHKLHVLVKLR